MPLLADLDPLQVVAVEPDLEAVEIPLGIGLVALSVLVRKVGVDPVRRAPRLVHDHGRERHDGQPDGSGKAEVHDRDGQATGDPHPAEPADERVQEQRHEPGDEEEEDDVTRRPRDHPQKQQQEREPDELDPARDLDLRRPAGHGSHRSASVVRLRPPPWDWSAFEDGSLALDPDTMPLHGQETWDTGSLRLPAHARSRAPVRVPARGRGPVVSAAPPAALAASSASSSSRSSPS